MGAKIVLPGKFSRETRNLARAMKVKIPYIAKVQTVSVVDVIMIPIILCVLLAKSPIFSG
jgi:hypothetical protein